MFISIVSKFSFFGDHLTDLFSHSKWYQEAVNRHELWQIYLNPIIPQRLPVIYLSINVLYSPTLLQGGCCLFHIEYQFFFDNFLCYAEIAQ